MTENLKSPFAKMEEHWKEYWDLHELYKWDSKASREEVFSIDTPPPTVSGVLHMGHVFSYVQTDFIARYQRMKGKSVFYPMGFDDNGLPTERLVEKIIGKKAHELPRSEFVEKCRVLVKEAEDQFRNLFRTLALSVDWTQEYQTISRQTQKMSQMSFIDLYRKNLVARKISPTFWDYIDKTAISQAEIEDREKLGIGYTILFSMEDNLLQIYTTRPELLQACVALLHHPDDTRYQAFTGQYASTPIFNKRVPIISDLDVDLEKGTGLVMCCTFGDLQDVIWWQRHNLPLIQGIGLDGKMYGELIDGLSIAKARAKIVEVLDKEQLITNRVEVMQSVKCAERSGCPLELISTYQWYISVLDQKEQILKKAAECNWYPEQMEVKLQNWVNGLNQNWCISRQRYFGIPFPVWYSKRQGEEGKVLLPALDQLPVDPMIDTPVGYSRAEVEADRDVMDTWATSAITPQISSLALNTDLAIDLEKHHKIFPFDLRPQSHEIIRTWTFGTIVKSLYHNNSIPWKNLMISGWCLASDRSKMSKSKGNVISPLEIISTYGVDVVRHWSSNAKLGSDVYYSEEIFRNSQKLINKLQNAFKFCFQHFHNLPEKPSYDLITHVTDRWVLTRLGRTIEAMEKSFESFEYSEARAAIEEFFWMLFCDNYIELAKKRLYSQEQSSLMTIYYCLDVILHLFAPFLPYITEELYQQMPYKLVSVHRRGAWPCEEVADLACLSSGDSIVAILNVVRKFKSISKMSLKAEIPKMSIYSLQELSQNALSDLANAMHIIKLDCLQQTVTESAISDLENSGTLLRSQCKSHIIYIPF